MSIALNGYGEIYLNEAGIEKYGYEKLTLAKNSKLEGDYHHIYIHRYGEKIPQLTLNRKYIGLAYYKPKDYYDSEGYYVIKIHKQDFVIDENNI